MQNREIWPQIEPSYSITFMLCRPSWAALGAAVIIAALFLAFAGDGLRAFFTADDMMNLYRAWADSPGELMRDDRPLVALVFRAMFACFGMNPLPYRVLAMGLLAANLPLLYEFCAMLSGSREAAALACLIGAYHAHLADLYYSTGTLYDLLCWFWVLGAFVYYLRIRSRGRYPNWRETAALLALYLCALGSKEMAATLPVLLALYECIYSRGKLVSWLRHGAYFWWLAIPLTIVYTLRKVIGPEAMTANEAYAIHLSAHAWFTAWKHYLNDLFYNSIGFSSFLLAALWTTMLALGLATRARELLFAWCMIMIAALPVVFIPPRGFFAFYVALPGWYLYAGGALVRLRDFMERKLAPAMAIRPAQLLLFLFVAVVAVPLHHSTKPKARAWVAGAHQAVRVVLEYLDQQVPALPRGGRVLFLADTYPADDHFLTSVFRLHYRDRDLRVDRVKAQPELADEAAHYDRLFVLDEKGLREASRGN